MKTKITIRLRHNPELTVRSHGWPLLAPFSISADELLWAVSCPSGPHDVRIRWSAQTCCVYVYVNASLSDEDIAFIRRAVRWMFRGNEDFTAFWKRCSGDSQLRRCIALQAGALIRSETLFEDVVKTICTVNCHWRNTKKMTKSLCTLFGTATQSGATCFPTPKVLDDDPADGI